jgi:L-alanine-DL-glutamate epimerase-like enolase superfamily enzyme
MTDLSSFSATISIDDELKLLIECEPYILKLRNEFGTSHSSTSERCNALVHVRIASIDGFGEIGLPPKKAHCYVASYDEVCAYVALYAKRVGATQLPSVNAVDPFAGWAHAMSYASLNGDRVSEIVLTLVDALDSVMSDANLEAHSAAARCGVESALLDCLGKHLKRPLYALMGLDDGDETLKRGFYTVAMRGDGDLDATIASVEREAMATTPFLKIKVSGDVDATARLLAKLDAHFEWRDGDERDWVLDANAAWDVVKAERMIDVIGPYARRIYMVEQPWPVLFASKRGGGGDASCCCDDEAAAGWRHVKRRYGDELDIYLIADESISNRADVIAVEPFAHGVNVKLEKAGGLRAALDAIVEARERNMVVWLGIMVSSTLASTTASSLLSLVTYGADLDGALLVTADSSRFTGSFRWGTASGLKHGYAGWTKDDRQRVFGVGCTPKWQVK